MSCYPRTVEPWMRIDPATSGIYDIFGCQIQFMPITVPESGSIRFKANQSALRQNYSIRLSITKEPYGMGLIWAGKPFVSLQATPNDFLVTNTNTSITGATPVWIVEPGSYYINAHNMENSISSWTIEFQE